MQIWEYTLARGVMRPDSKWNVKVVFAGDRSETLSGQDLDWPATVANTLGQDGWELVDRSSTGVGQFGQINMVELLFKRPSSA